MHLLIHGAFQEPPIVHSPKYQTSRLERVILRRDFNHEVASYDGDLLHDIGADLGNLGEEEEGEDAGYGSERSGGHATGGC
jgi:hypothetical protein